MLRCRRMGALYSVNFLLFSVFNHNAPGYKVTLHALIVLHPQLKKYVAFSCSVLHSEFPDRSLPTSSATAILDRHPHGLDVRQ